MDVKSDTLTLMLCLAVNQHLTDVEQSLAIKKCAKFVYHRTKDKPLKNMCRLLRNEQKHHKVIKAIEMLEINYIREFM